MLNRKTFKFIVLMLVTAVVGSPYISSWLPKFYGMPVGPAFRLLCILFFYSVIFMVLLVSSRKIYISGCNLFFLTLLFIGLILSVSFNDSNLLQIVLGLHAFIFYPMIFLTLCCYFNTNKSEEYWREVVLFLKRMVAAIFFITSIVAIIDVVTKGQFTLLLGYDPHYGGDDFTLITRYYDLVRANGGFADALAFGYLMAAGFIFFSYNMFKKHGNLTVNMVGAGLVALACALSITRGAILALAVAAIIFICKSKWWIKFLAITMGMIVLVGVLLSSYSDVFVGRFTDSDKGSKVSTTLRYDMAMESLNFLEKKPLGEGLGTQGAGSTLSTSTERVNTDNFIFHSWLEIGLFGGTVFLLLILYQFYALYQRAPGARPFVLALFALYWLSAAVSSSLQSGVLSVMFWIVCFIIYAEANLKIKTTAIESVEQG